MSNTKYRDLYTIETMGGFYSSFDVFSGHLLLKTTGFGE